MKNIVLLCIVFVLFSCGGKRRNMSGVDESGMTTIVLADDNKIYLQEWVRDIEVIPLETSDRVLVGRIDQLIITDENIIVCDTRQANIVSVFDRDGKHIATINRRGRGPQEYTEIDHVAMLPDNQTIAIHDNSGGKVLHFSLDGRLITSIPTTFWFIKMEYIGDDDIVCVSYGAEESDPGLKSRKDRNNFLWFTDGKFKIRSNTMPVRYDREEFGIITPIIRKFDDRIYINRPYSDTIYRAAQDGLKAIYRIDMERIDGVANFAPNTTREQRESLEKSKATFLGFFADNDDFVSISISTPPRGVHENYLYSKQSGKVYAIQGGYRGSEHPIFRFMPSPQTSIADMFAGVVQPHHLIMYGGEDVIEQHPKLATLTEDSNPVIVLYSLKDEL